MRVDLPSGRWVEFRDPSTLTEGQRRPVRSAMMRTSADFRSAMQSLETAREGDADAKVIRECENLVERTIQASDMDVMSEMNDLMACALIESADQALGFSTPCTPDQLVNLPGGDYDVIAAHAADFLGAFMGNRFKPSADPASPTSPLNA